MILGLCFQLKHLKRYTVNGLFALVTCVLMYRDWATSESSAAEIAFRILPQYVQILITLLVGTTRQLIVIHYHISGDCKTLLPVDIKQSIYILSKRRYRPNVVRLVLLGGDVRVFVQQQLVTFVASRQWCYKLGRYTPGRIIKIVIKRVGGVF